MSAALLSPLPATNRKNIATSLIFAGLASSLGAICVWQIGERGASSDSLRLLAQWLTGVSCIVVTFLFGALVLAQRERQQRIRLQATLEEQTAELLAQTETAAALAGEVEKARAEVQRFNRLHTEELERSNQELEQFAYVASHDLQEPLRAISGCVEILRLRYASQLDEHAHELIAHSVAGVFRMRQLIEDLLEYSRVRLKRAPAPVSVETALQTALKQLESAMEKAGAVIEHDELPTVCADPGQLVQLLQNLLSNALKYRSASAPLIKISAVRTDLMWVIAVRDNGIGIESKYFDRIFSIFQRLHTRDEYPGTGIGLALSRRIVDQAGGSIWIESELGTGSTFSFTLPAVTGNLTAAA